MKKPHPLPLFLLLLLTSLGARAVTLPGPLIETDWLAKHQGDVFIMDVRADTRSFGQAPKFRKNKKTGKQQLAAVGGHIAGAVLLPYKKIRGKRSIDGKTVDKMLIDKAAFEKLMQEIGLNKDSTVVIVTKGQSDSHLTIATRIYWQLKYYGHDSLAILNGGMAQWLLDGRKVNTDPSKPSKGNWVATAERQEIFATTAEVSAAVQAGNVQLMDNRPLSQYLGIHNKSYVYDKGHIPGAKVFPTEIIVDHGKAAKFLPLKDLKQLVQTMGLNPGAKTISYCNSGHLATGGWFVMHELLGNTDTQMYDGSMHEWTLNKQPVTRMKME